MFKAHASALALDDYKLLSLGLQGADQTPSNRNASISSLSHGHGGTPWVMGGGSIGHGIYSQSYFCP